MLIKESHYPSPSHTKWVKQRRVRTDFYKEVRGRLHDEVGRYLKFLKEHPLIRDGKEVGSGFYTSIRLLMPVIETVARTSGVDREIFLSNHLKLRRPNLAWNLIRDGLLHNEGMLGGKYQSKGKEYFVSPILVLDPTVTTHGAFPPEVEMVSIYALYQSLDKYLDEMIKGDGDEECDVIVAIEYLDTADNEVGKIISEIKGSYLQDSSIVRRRN